MRCKATETPGSLGLKSVRDTNPYTQKKSVQSGRKHKSRPRGLLNAIDKCATSKVNIVQAESRGHRNAQSRTQGPRGIRVSEMIFRNHSYTLG